METYGMTDAHLDQMQWEAEQEEVDLRELEAQQADAMYEDCMHLEES